MDVQIFGTHKSSDTRKALRFFSERGINTHFVDLNERPMSPGELDRFVQRFGIDALVDRESKRYAALGLRAASPSAGLWRERLLTEPLLLRQPLVRAQQRFTVGLAEAEWKAWCGR